MNFSYNTNRLSLKILKADYASNVLSFYNRNREHFEPWEQKRSLSFYTFAHQYASLLVEEKLFNNRELLRFWIFLKDDPDTIIGTVNFYNISRGCFFNCQIGYKIDHDHLGQGYAYEAISFAMKVLKKEFNLHRIEGRIMPSNKDSIKLIEKLGFNNEGLAKSSIKVNGKWEDHYVYAYVYED